MPSTLVLDMLEARVQNKESNQFGMVTIYKAIAEVERNLDWLLREAQ